MSQLHIASLLSIACLTSPMPGFGAESPLEGAWAFALPDDRPAWLRIVRHDDDATSEFTAELLWSVGSARPVKNVVVEGNTIRFTRAIKWLPYGDPKQRQRITSPFVGRVDGDLLRLSFQHESESNVVESIEIIGKRLPPIPARPNLSMVQFGKPIPLFDGVSLAGWKLSDSNKINGWSALDGALSNATPKTDFGAYGAYGNLQTVRTFGDFRLSLEYNVPKGGNSGVYLRGMYEAQVVDRDSRMQGIQGPGAIFGRIEPSMNAGRPGGEWNRYVLTLVDRHVTVELNGRTVIDNQPLIGCTGGGLSADDSSPGPLLLQGDHTSVAYRNVMIEPVIEERE